MHEVLRQRVCVCVCGHTYASVNANYCLSPVCACPTGVSGDKAQLLGSRVPGPDGTEPGMKEKDERRSGREEETIGAKCAWTFATNAVLRLRFAGHQAR